MDKTSRKYKNRELFKRFLPYYKNYRKDEILDLICAAFTTVSAIALPLIVGRLTDATSSGKLTANLIIRLGLRYLFLKALEVVARYLMQSIGHIMGAKIERDMRADAFSHILTMSTQYFTETKVGQIMSRLTTDLFDITEFSHHCPEELFIGLIKLVVSFIILVRLDRVLAIIVYLLVPLMIYFSASKRKAFRDSTAYEKMEIGEINSRIEDTLLGINVVKSFANENVELDKFKKDNDRFVDIKRDKYYNMAGFHMVSQIFSGLMYLVLIFLGGFSVLRGRMTAGNLVTFTLYVDTLITTVDRLVEFTDQFERGMIGIERFLDIMDRKPTVYSLPSARELTDVKGEITFDHVYFRYKDAQADSKDRVLADIDFKIGVGENVALVGPSGAGKTTLIKLIPRFYDLDQGRILIDGEDIRSFSLESLRDKIGIVQQEVYLFGGSVADNIKYGKADATEEEVIDASKLAGAYDFIMDLPQGFDTYIGERGIKLSGGQKQRLSIARVFLKNPPILILDEATSSLDNESERIVQASLEKLTKGRTTLTIAHRLSTIINADNIFVMTDDGIVEEGSHKELMEKKGAYYRLYNSNNQELFG